MIIISLLVNVTNEIKWSSGTTSQALFTSQFTYGTYTNPLISYMKVDSTNSKIYLWGDITDSGNNYGFLRKIGTDYSQVQLLTNWNILKQKSLTA